MRRRRVLLGIALVALVASGAFASLAVLVGSSAPVETVQPRASDTSDPLAGETSTGLNQAVAADSMASTVYWVSAAVALLILVLVMFPLAREVRIEKRRRRRIRIKRLVANDLRRYRQNREASPERNT